MDTASATNYKNPSRISGVITEAWAAREMYCCACSSDCLSPFPTNNPAFDFVCTSCKRTYQLKAKNNQFTSRVVDGDHQTMENRILKGDAPNLLLLHYAPQTWTVQNLFLIPSFFFTVSALEKRKPLGLHARRANWTGCNILLSAIAPDGKLGVVTDGKLSDPELVRNWYHRVAPLEQISSDKRGWALDVLRVVRALNKPAFTLADVYAYEAELAILYPENQHIRDKIRQQLQVLRDKGLLEFLGQGRYQLK
jgi:type II restriction enzyme